MAAQVLFVKLGFAVTATSTAVLLLQAAWSAWYLVLYFLIAVNAALVALLVIAYFDQMLALKVTQVIFHIIWIPIAFVLQIRANIFSITHGGCTDFRSGDQETIPDWLRQAMMVALIDGASTRSMQWLVVFGTCKLFSITVGEFLGRKLPKDSEEIPAWLAESAVVQNSRTAVSLTSMAFACAYLQSPGLISLSLAYCILTETIAYPVVLETLKRLNVENLDGLEEFVAHALYIAGESLIALTYLIVASMNMNVLALPCLYFGLITPMLKLHQEVWNKVREENESLRSFSVASREELRDYSDVCPVCLTQMSSARKTPCEHFFHGRCLRLSMRETPKCPMCKRQLPSNERGLQRAVGGIN